MAQQNRRVSAAAHTWVREVVRRGGFRVVRDPVKELCRALQRNSVDLVVDVGAASGGYGSSLRRGGYAGELLSFEPLREAYAALVALSQTDARWNVVNCALGDRAHGAEMHVAANSDSSSLVAMLDLHEEAAPDARYVSTQTVAVDTLDNVLAARPSAQRVFLKIDVQGYERQVLAGATDSMPRIVGLQVELSLAPLYAGCLMLDEGVELMTSLGFDLHQVVPGFADPASGRLLQLDGIFFPSV